MARHIDIDKMNKWMSNPEGCGGVGYCLGGMLSDCNECYYKHGGAEDVTPVIHAKWEHKDGIYGVVYCSNCGFELKYNNTNFCPDCGAKMDKE